MARKKISELPLDNAVIGTDVVPIVSDGATKRVQLSTLGTYFATVGGGQPASHAASHGQGGSDAVTVAIGQVTGLQTALDGKQATGTYATLVGGKVPAEQLPGFVDDILEYANLAALPGTGAAGVLYVTLDANKVYRWSGSAYVEVSPGATAWSDITGKPSTFTPSSHTHATSDITGLDATLSGIDSAITARALASDFDQGVKTTDSPEFDGLTLSSLTMSNGDITFGAGGGAFAIAGFGVYIDIEQATIGTNGILGWNFLGDMDFTSANVTGIDAADVGAAAASHAHSVGDISFTATDRLLGRSSSGAGVGEEITCTSAGRALLDDADAAAQRTTLGLVAVASSGSASDIGSGTLSVSRLPVVLEQTQAIGNSGANKTLSLATGSVQTVTLSASCTFTMPTATAGASITLILTQGSNYTATFTGVKWPGGTAPTITATANAIDVLVFVSDGTNWYGVASQKFS